MTPQQNRLCELMLEFHALCEKNAVPYYLVGPQLLHAAQDHMLHGYEMDVAMFWKDWKKLEKDIQLNEDREIESILDGGSLPVCYFRYVDKNSLLLDLNRYGMLAKPGIGIHIHIIRNERKKGRLLTFLEKGMEDGLLRRHSLARTAVGVLRTFMGKVRFGYFLMNLLKTICAKSSALENTTKLHEPGNISCVFRPNDWTSKAVVTLSGMKLRTVKNYKKYLSQRYGKSWGKRPTDAVKEDYRCIFSPSLPYRRYMAEVESKNLITKDLLKRTRRFKQSHEKFQEMKKAEQLGWEKSIFFSGERFRLWKKYMPLKEQILSLYQAERLDEVELLLTDYLTVLNKYLKMNMVLCFDNDILDVVKNLYLLYGKKAIVQKINKYILAEDLLPIEATWKTEGAE